MSGKRRAKALSEEEKHLRGTQRSPWWMLVTFSVESKEARTRTSPWHTFFFSESVCRRYFRRSRTRWQSRITQNVHNHHSIHNILTLIGNKVVPTMHGLCNPAILHIFHPIVASPSTNSIQFRVCRLNSDAGRRLRTNSPRPPRPAPRPCPASRRAILRKFDAFLFLSFLEGRVSLKIHFERKTLMCCSKKWQNIPCSCYRETWKACNVVSAFYTEVIKRHWFFRRFSKWWQATHQPPFWVPES